MKTLTRLLLGLAMAMTGAAMSTGAYANSRHFDAYKKTSVVVTYNGLNLATKSGVSTLYNRIRRAGHQACGPMYGTDPLNPGLDWTSWMTCYRGALNRAAAKVGNQQLSAMIHERTHSLTQALDARG